MKKIALIVAVLLLGLPLAAKDRTHHNPKATNEDVILHAWSWNLDTIAKHLKVIADAGYTIIQTSPVQPHYNPTGVNKKLFDPTEQEGNWYYYYQPTAWKVGNASIGSKADMAALIDSANKYNVRIIVDVLPNHTAFDVDAVEEDFFKAVGGRNKIYHSKGLTPITDYNDRYQCTLEGTGGLPDVNTENPDFQKYYMQFVNELLKMGVRGFRYDTAKHIGVHSDPVDTESGVKVNDFWDVATGLKSVKGVKLAVPYDSLFVYGEILQDRNVPEAEYAAYMGQTASGYGHKLREALEKHSAKGIDLINWDSEMAPEYLTTWVESHDTYANAHESAGISDDLIRAAFVFLTARQNGVPLFFSRPAGRSAEKVWGNNEMGASGNDAYFHPEIKAANNFRKQMKGQTEDIQQNEEGTILLVNRGKKGAAIVNIGKFADFVDLPTALPAGTYHDKVYNQPFTVRNGRLKGIASAQRTYIITK